MNNETDSRRHFIPEWAAAKGVTRSAIIAQTGVDKSTLSRWYSMNALPRPRHLKMLAKVFGIDVSDLFRAPEAPNATAMAEEEIIASINDMVDGTIEQTHKLPFGGTVEAGTFRPVELLDQSGEPRRVDIGSVNKFHLARQAAYEIRGDSMELRGLQDGMWAVGINAYDFAEFYRRSVQDGQIVVVRRTRFQGSEIELTIKEVKLYRDRTELVPRSKNPAHKTLEIPAVEEQRDEEIEIIAIVAWAGWSFL